MNLYLSFFGRQPQRRWLVCTFIFLFQLFSWWTKCYLILTTAPSFMWNTHSICLICRYIGDLFSSFHQLPAFNHVFPSVSVLFSDIRLLEGRNHINLACFLYGDLFLLGNFYKYETVCTFAFLYLRRYWRPSFRGRRGDFLPILCWWFVVLRSLAPGKSRIPEHLS